MIMGNGSLYMLHKESWLAVTVLFFKRIGK